MTHRDRWLAGMALVAIVGAGVWSYVSGGLAAALVSPGLDDETRVRYIREYFQQWGPVAPIIYMMLVMMEVVIAPIPGTMFYLPGGFIFGWLVGGLASLFGNVIGAGLCCLIARSLGKPYVERLVSPDVRAKYDAALSRNAVWVILLLRINPLTSSDLVSYAAGLTSAATWHVMLGTLLGMAPLCFLQAYFAEELFTRFPVLIYPLAAVCVVYVAYVAWILSRLKTAS